MRHADGICGWAACYLPVGQLANDTMCATGWWMVDGGWWVGWMAGWIDRSVCRSVCLCDCATVSDF